jgi:DNA-binding transcriptional MerR regulator
MSYSYLNDIKPLQDQGVSNADIAAHLSNRTARPMQSAESIYELSNTGAVISSPVLISQRTGTLIDYWQGLPDGQEKDLIAFFLSTLFDGNPVKTNEYPRSTQFALAELNMTPDLQLVAESLVNLAGGRPDVGTTEQNVVDIQAAYESEQQIDQQLSALDQQYWSLHNQHIAPLQQSRNVNSADWKTAIQSMADGWVE